MGKLADPHPGLLEHPQRQPVASRDVLDDRLDLKCARRGDLLLFLTRQLDPAIPAGFGSTPAKSRIARVSILLVTTVSGAPSPQGGNQPATATPYAGLSSRARGGIAATVSLERVDRVGRHFAVWAGVDGATPGGQQLWVQVGVKEDPGDTTPRLYLETVQRGQRRSFADLGPVGTGQRVWVAVLRTRLGWVAIAPSGLYGPFRLPASEATVTAEALADAVGSASAASIQVAEPHRAWARLSGAMPVRDRGWKLRLRRDGFEATGGERHAWRPVWTSAGDPTTHSDEVGRRAGDLAQFSSSARAVSAQESVLESPGPTDGVTGTSHDEVGNQ